MDFDDPSSSDESSVRAPSPVPAANGPPPPHLRPDVAALPGPRGRRNGHEVQSFVFDDDDDEHDSDDGDSKEVMGRAPQPAAHNALEEPLHHQLVAADDEMRPMARHGCDALGRVGRLGRLTEETDVQDGFEEEDESKDIVTSGAGVPVSIEDEREWDSVLGPMALVDTTLLTRFYTGSSTTCEESEVGLEESVNVTETMVKVLSLFSAIPAEPGGDAAGEPRQVALDTLHRLASHMQDMQRTLTEAGLTIDSQLKLQSQQNSDGEIEADTATDQSGVDLRKVVCRGVHSVHVDSACRLMGVIDIDACAVSLSDVIAFSSLPFSQSELVAILNSIVRKVGALHDAGLVHGCLHGGNVLCCTDDGRTALAGACGIMSNPLLPADASFISPRLASALQPFVQLVWNRSEQLHAETLPWASDPLFHTTVLERYGCTGKSELRAQVSDDIYAIGILAVSCLLGVPPFHSATLKEVVETLAPYYRDAHDGGEAILLGNLLASDYALQRFGIAGYTEEFVATAKDFVETCLRAASSPAAAAHVVTSDLLTHSFFADINASATPTRNDGGVSMDESEMDAAALVDRTVHCLLYPIFTVMECVEKDCGSIPLLPRLLRNSIFATRWEALQRSKLHPHGDEAACGKDAVRVLWPYLASRENSYWDESNLHESSKADKEGQSEENAVRSLLYRSLVPPCVSVSQKTADCHAATLASVVASKGVRIDTEAHALVFSGKADDHLVLYRDELPTEYSSSVDTLILQELEDCVVQILLSFRFVVLLNLRRCKLFLGPCYYLYCENVSDCAPVVVASAHVLLRDVTVVEFHCGGCPSPRNYEDVPISSDVVFLPYTVAYAGLTADFAAVSLPQEHVSVMAPRVEITDSAPSASRKFKLCNPLRGGFDYPYSHALTAFGTRLLHENDCISDMFLFFSEVAGKAVRIAQIHGGHDAALGDLAAAAPALSSRPSLRHSQDEGSVGAEASGTAAEGNNSNCPIIFIMDFVGDCIIEDCSHCTVFIVGSSESVSVRHCSELRLFLMAKEVLFEYCNHVEAHLFVTEYLLVDHCYQMDLSPLVLEAPRLEEVIASIVDGCTDEALHQRLEKALRQKDERALNVLRRFEAGANEIDMEECVDVRISSRSEEVILVDFVPTGAQLSKFFYEASHASSRGKHWVMVPFLEKTWARGEASTRGRGIPPVRLHDLVNASILRLPGSLNLRAAGDEASPLVDVILERFSLGVVHLTEAIRTLIIRRCTGPLDIVVCAATRVIMESCEQVTLQTACGAFTARNCQACHIALHVNTPPQYENCTFMQASTLNITSKDFEGYLTRAGVELDLNLFDNPAVRSSDDEWEVLSPDKLLESNSVDSVEMARFVLHSPVTLVPPLPATCLGVEDASFIDVLEDRVNHEKATRPCYGESIVAALSFLSSRQAAQVSAAAAAAAASKSVPREELRFARSLSPLPPMLGTGQAQERHVAPPVERGVENAKEGPTEYMEESSAPSVSNPTSELPQSPAHSPEVSGTHTVHRDDEPRSGGSSSSGSSGSEANNVPMDDDAHIDDETAEVVGTVVAAPHDGHAADGDGDGDGDDDDDDPATVRKLGETRARRGDAEPQFPTEAKGVSCDASSPPETLADGRLSGDEEESALDLVTYRSFPGEVSIVDDRMSATDPAATTPRREGGESAGERSPAAVPPAHGSKAAAAAQLANSPPCLTLPVEAKVDEGGKSGGGDTNAKTTSTPQQALVGDATSVRGFILEVHPSEEEAVRAALAMVAASRDAAASARRTSGSSTEELQRRVAEALRRLQKLSS
ncbi:transferase [Trypanosoma conorhini]|uniref:Transferase n=1 Tax=Trypanosoma conorhini TaxID=83891 RepID=A0A422Q5W0_9TRYP|nr:transferase [Trypanosoma conorhini]RNF25356.1 transferase [Trypanosoma conorhini]